MMKKILMSAVIGLGLTLSAGVAVAAPTSKTLAKMKAAKVAQDKLTVNLAQAVTKAQVVKTAKTKMTDKAEPLDASRIRLTAYGRITM